MNNWEDRHIYAESKHSINTLNGILNDANLEFAKKSFLNSVMKEQLDLVKTKQHYPHNDISEVDMTIDFVIMSGDTYRKMIKVIESLPQEREESIKKYINFPKLQP